MFDSKTVILYVSMIINGINCSRNKCHHYYTSSQQIFTQNVQVFFSGNEARL